MRTNKLIILFIITLCISIFSVSAATYDGLYMYGAFDNDDGTNINNSITNLNSGFKNTANLQASGCFIGKCYNYTPDGLPANFTGMPTNTALNYTTNLWVKTSTCSQSNRYIWTNNNNIVIHTNNTGGYYDAVFAPTYSNWVNTVNTVCYPNNWTMLTMSYTSDGKATFYFNGTKISTTSSGATPPTLSSSHALLNWRPGNSVGFTGTIDEVAEWNRSLSDAEVTTIYNNYLVNITPLYRVPFSIKGTIKYNTVALSNATIILYNEGTSSIYSTTSSNVNGSYIFNGTTLTSITNGSVWSVWAYYRNASVYYGRSINVTVSVAD